MAIFITPGGGGSGTPGGSDTQIQFNDGGAFGGDVDLTYNKTTNLLTTKGDVRLDDGGTFSTTLQMVTATANRTISFPDATGTVALVAGSSGQLIFNNNGAYAGVSTLTADGSGNITLSGKLTNSFSSTPTLGSAKTFTGTWATGGTATTNKPHLLLEPTGTTSTAWSTSGTGLGVNAASGFAGNLLDLQVNGTSQFRIASNGGVVFPAPSSTRITLRGVEVNALGINLTDFGEYYRFSSTNGFFVGGAAAIGWANGGLTSTLINDLLLVRDAAGTLAQRNGTNAQTFRVYNTYTSATNYELGKLEWASNVFRIGTEKGSGGGTARALELQTDGTTRVQISRDGCLRRTQPAPVAVNTTATLTIANLQCGIITTTTAAAVNMTLPTGTDIEAGFAVNTNDLAFEWSVINTGANAATVVANTDHTIVGAAQIGGEGAVAAGMSGRFATRRTAANTYVTYRIS